MFNNNSNVGPGIVDFLLYNRRIALKDDYQRKSMNMLAYISVELNYFGTLAKMFVIPAKEKQLLQENFFKQCSHSSNRYCNGYKHCIQ